MPMSVTHTAGKGVSYIDIRRSGSHGIHQVKLVVAGLAGAVDANNTLPPGLPITKAGIPVAGAADLVAGVVGPEGVNLEAANHFGNVIESGVLNYDAIKANLGRAWTANELAAVALVGALRIL